MLNEKSKADTRICESGHKMTGMGFEDGCPECEAPWKPTETKTQEWLKEEIKNWEFATCPTEEKEPFFWKWSEHGLEMLTAYIFALFQKVLIETAKNERIKCIADDCDSTANLAMTLCIKHWDERIETARKEERERIVEILGEMKTNHTEEDGGTNLKHDKDEYWGCCECYEDRFYNQALKEAIEKIKETNE